MFIRRVIASVAAGALLSAGMAVPVQAQMPQVPSSSDPLDTPAARKAINDAWKAIPSNVRSQITLPKQVSRYIDKPTKPAATKPVNNTPQRPANFQAAVDRVVARFGGSAAIAYSDGATTRVFGDDTARESYSTVKVPISVAALRHDRGNMSKVRAAITYSDNDSATIMRASVPAGAVDQVVRDAGSRTAAPVTGWWGNTPWAPSQQAIFVANLPCVDGAGPVVDLMGQVTNEQRWGLGKIPGAKFKSGWAQRGGQWIFRQMVRVPTQDGYVAVALLARPGSGGYGAGLNMLNALADAVAPHVESLPPAQCQ